MATNGSASAEAPLVIDCDTCVMRRTGVCRDCVVSFLLDGQGRSVGGGRHTDAVVVDAAELRALRLLADQGLVPALRHRSSA